MLHEMKLPIESLADTLAEEFRKTQLFWLMWNATDPTKVLPFPTIALWIDLNEQNELSGFVRTYDRTKPEFTPPQHSMVYELDTAARYGFRKPSLDHPDVDHISDLLLQPFWKPLLQNEVFIGLLLRRYRARHIDANKHKNDMVDFYLLILIAEREASETHEAQADDEPESKRLERLRRAFDRRAVLPQRFLSLSRASIFFLSSRVFRALKRVTTDPT